MASNTLSGADILVQCLVNHGVDTVFAYPGGASMPIHQALTRFQKQLRTILPRHEQGGGFMAEGYARSTGRVGVCIATSGPGATNFVTCLADAKMDSIPIIAITGQVGTHVIGTDAFQETPIVEVSRPITKHHYLVQRTEDLPRVMKEAFHIATTGRPGPVIVDIPKDVQNRSIVPDFDPPMNLPGYQPDRRATRDSLEQVFALIRQSKRPIIYAGGGIVTADAGPLLKAFAEKTGIPVALDGPWPRRFPQRPLSLPANAWHARDRLRQLRHQRGRPAPRVRRPLRRPRHRQGQRVRQARQDRPYRHRSVGDQQDQDRDAADLRRHRPGPARHDRHDRRGSQANSAGEPILRLDAADRQMARRGADEVRRPR